MWTSRLPRMQLVVLGDRVFPLIDVRGRHQVPVPLRDDQAGPAVRVDDRGGTPAARIASIVLARTFATSSSLSSRSSPFESSSRSNAGSISSLAGESFRPIVRSAFQPASPGGGQREGRSANYRAGEGIRTLD